MLKDTQTMFYLICYIITLAVFSVIDITWLSTMGEKLYIRTLGDILAPEIRYGPAAVFYFLYPIGIIYFAVLPALKTGSLSTAILNGVLFGLFTYGTYELTNYATLRNWTLNIAVIDCLYGAFIGLAASATTFLLAPPIARWLGIAVP